MANDLADVPVSDDTRRCLTLLLLAFANEARDARRSLAERIEIE
jgi:hypothetical protein